MIAYVAKDRDGEICIHTEKPIYNAKCGVWLSDSEIFGITNSFPEFDSMSYTDEPIKVEINIKRL